MAIKLIVGLGNVGTEHEDDRHNAGFWFVDALAREALWVRCSPLISQVLASVLHFQHSFRQILILA